MTTEKLLNQVKYIEDELQFLVHDYIRDFEKHLKSIYSMPEIVLTTCLLYYHIFKVFGDVADELKLSGMNNNTVTKVQWDQDWFNAVYGDIWYGSTCNQVIK